MSHAAPLGVGEVGFSGVCARVLVVKRWDFLSMDSFALFAWF